jgi:hypothetical protein
LEAAAFESLQVVQRPLEPVKMVQQLLELQNDGIFAIGKFPDAMMVGGVVVEASFETGDSAA